MTEIQIRHADRDDAIQIADLLGQLGYPARAEDIPSRIERMRADGNSAILVAVSRGVAVGLATTHLLTVINRHGKVAMLSAIVVDERLRGEGIGRQLVYAVEAYARESGCERLTATTYLDRTGAHKFYESTGFELTGRRYGKSLRG
jgi:GNAT superfamily N-acetyltransferase